MKWILILWLFHITGSNGISTALTSIQFNSEGACKRAGEAVLAREMKNANFVCVAAGAVGP